MPNGQQRSARLSFLPSRLSGREIPLPTLRFASEELDGCFKYERKMDSVRVCGPHAHRLRQGVPTAQKLVPIERI